MTCLWRRVSILTASCAYFSFAFFDLFYINCQLDYAELTNSTPGDVATAVSAKLASYCVGCIVFGWINNRTDHRKTLAVSLVVAALSNIWTTMSATVNQLMISMSLLGLMTAGIDVSSNSWILQLGGRDAGSGMQVMYLSNSVGSVLLPLLTAPYLSTREHKSRIVEPAVIAGLTAVIPFILLLVVILKQKDSTHEPLGAGASDSATIASTTRSELYSRIIGCCLLGLYYQLESVGYGFTAEYAVFSEVRMTKSSAAYLVSFTTISFGIDRLIFIPFVGRFSPKSILFFHFSIIMIGLIIFLAFGGHSLPGVWVAYTLISFGQGSCLPAILTFLGEIIPVSSSGTGWYLFAARIMSVPGSLLVGHLIESHPIVLPIYLMVTFSLSAILLLFLCWKTKS